MSLIIDTYFDEYPARKKVAEMLFLSGMGVREGKIFAGEVEVPVSSVARAAGVNRKIVYYTIEFIEKNYALRSIFERIEPMANLKKVGPIVGWEVLELEMDMDGLSCALKDVVGILSEKGCHVRQIVGEEPLLSDGKIFIVLTRPVPMDLLERIKNIPSVKDITLHTSESDRSKLACTFCKVKACPRRALISE